VSQAPKEFKFVGADDGRPKSSAGGTRVRSRMTVEEHIAAHGGDVAAAEKSAARELTFKGEQVPLGIAMIGFVLSLFFPHSGEVLGIDVLFDSETARFYLTTLPERIYVWAGVVGVVALTVAAIVTRLALVGYLAWFFSGVSLFYSIFAMWMRQSRPPTDPGVGPSFGLIMGAVCVLVAAVSWSFVIVHKSSLQKALDAVRRRGNPRAEDKVAQTQMSILDQEARRINEGQDNPLLVDDRRRRAAQRRKREQG